MVVNPIRRRPASSWVENPTHRDRLLLKHQMSPRFPMWGYQLQFYDRGTSLLSRAAGGVLSPISWSCSWVIEILTIYLDDWRRWTRIMYYEKSLWNVDFYVGATCTCYFLPRIQEGSEELMVPPNPGAVIFFQKTETPRNDRLEWLAKNSAWEFEALGIPS